MSSQDKEAGLQGHADQGVVPVVEPPAFSTADVTASNLSDGAGTQHDHATDVEATAEDSKVAGPGIDEGGDEGGAGSSPAQVVPCSDLPQDGTGEIPIAPAPRSPGMPPVRDDVAHPPTSSDSPGEPVKTGWASLRQVWRPHLSRAQLLAAVLCAVLGFALAVQLAQNQHDEFSGLRQSDLVRILDDVSRRSDSLEREATALRETEFELRSGSDSQQAAVELAEKNAAVQGILSGRLPAEGPGLEITIVEGANRITAARLFNVLEELRNAGAEAIEVNGIRMVTSSYFQDATQGMVIDGISVTPPYRWTAIGDPQTLEPAIAIPGGAMASITTNGGRTTIQQKDLVQIRSVRDPSDPTYATPTAD